MSTLHPKLPADAITVREAADDPEVGLAKSRIYQIIRAGTVEAYRYRGRTYFSRGALLEALSPQPVLPTHLRHLVSGGDSA